MTSQQACQEHGPEALHHKGHKEHKVYCCVSNNALMNHVPRVKRDLSF